jgi:glycosyltransferase involved in cell wall biosynthesis
VVPAKDPSALAAGVVSLLTDPPLRARLASAAARRAEAFDIRRSVARIEAVYEELLS